MHIIIAFLTSLAGLIWALHALQNSGLDLNALNPFHWLRRHRWQKKYATRPLYCLETPVEAACVLLVGVVKQEGEISREQKQTIISLFEEAFHMAQNEAAEMFGSAVFLLRDEVNLVSSVKHILDPVKDAFSMAQARSLADLLQKVATIEGSISELQQSFIETVTSQFEGLHSKPSTWHAT